MVYEPTFMAYELQLLWHTNPDFYQKNPRVRKILVRNSGAGNGCANFMDTWKNAFFLQENRHVHKIPCFGGGGIWGFRGGGVPIFFYGRGDFSEFMPYELFLLGVGVVFNVLPDNLPAFETIVLATEG